MVGCHAEHDGFYCIRRLTGKQSCRLVREKGGIAWDLSVLAAGPSFTPGNAHASLIGLLDAPVGGEGTGGAFRQAQNGVGQVGILDIIITLFNAPAMRFQ